MSLAAALLAAPIAADAATEGKKVITAMLIVGLVFCSVIALGQLAEWARHRRRYARSRR
jgi:predicted membrane protein